MQKLQQGSKSFYIAIAVFYRLLALPQINIANAAMAIWETDVNVIKVYIAYKTDDKDLCYAAYYTYFISKTIYALQ